MEQENMCSDVKEGEWVGKNIFYILFFKIIK